MDIRQKLRLVEDANESFNVYFGEVYLGKFYIEVDGFYVWWWPPSLEAGAGIWYSWQLELIASKLDELNQPYIDHLIKEGLW